MSLNGSWSIGRCQHLAATGWTIGLVWGTLSNLFGGALRSSGLLDPSSAPYASLVVSSIKEKPVKKHHLLWVITSLFALSTPAFAIEVASKDMEAQDRLKVHQAKTLDGKETGTTDLGKAKDGKWDSSGKLDDAKGTKHVAGAADMMDKGGAPSIKHEDHAVKLGKEVQPSGKADFADKTGKSETPTHKADYADKMGKAGQFPGKAEYSDKLKNAGQLPGKAAYTDKVGKTGQFSSQAGHGSKMGKTVYLPGKTGHVGK